MATSSRRGVRVKSASRAKLSMQPRVTLEALECGALWTEYPTFVVTAPADDVSGYLAAPVSSVSAKAKLAQVTSDWERVLVPAATVVPAPVILSARSNWSCANLTLEVYGTAYIIDGACRLETVLREAPRIRLPFFVVFGLDDAAERLLRSQFVARGEISVVSEQKVDTSSPRLTIAERWITFTIESDPFVVPTVRGYAPAIMVRREGSAHTEHVLIGAKSLAQPLEELRRGAGRLLGIRLAVRKAGPQATSAYEVKAAS